MAPLEHHVPGMLHHRIGDNNDITCIQHKMLIDNNNGLTSDTMNFPYLRQMLPIQLNCNVRCRDMLIDCTIRFEHHEGLSVCLIVACATTTMQLQ